MLNQALSRAGYEVRSTGNVATLTISASSMGGQSYNIVSQSAGLLLYDLLLNIGGNASLPGTLTANGFSGDGSLLTNLSGSAIASGTIGASYLPTNIAIAKKSTSAPRVWKSCRARNRPSKPRHLIAWPTRSATWPRG